jgi:hypothetical protein
MINLANLSYRTGKKIINLDAATGAIVGNDKAVALDTLSYREGYQFNQ